MSEKTLLIQALLASQKASSPQFQVLNSQKINFDQVDVQKLLAAISRGVSFDISNCRMPAGQSPSMSRSSSSKLPTSIAPTSPQQVGSQYLILQDAGDSVALPRYRNRQVFDDPLVLLLWEQSGMVSTYRRKMLMERLSRDLNIPIQQDAEVGSKPNLLEVSESVSSGWALQNIKDRDLILMGLEMLIIFTCDLDTLIPRQKQGNVRIGGVNSSNAENGVNLFTEIQKVINNFDISLSNFEELRRCVWVDFQVVAANAAQVALEKSGKFDISAQLTFSNDSQSEQGDNRQSDGQQNVKAAINFGSSSDTSETGTQRVTEASAEKYLILPITTLSINKENENSRSGATIRSNSYNSNLNQQKDGYRIELKTGERMFCCDPSYLNPGMSFSAQEIKNRQSKNIGIGIGDKMSDQLNQGHHRVQSAKDFKTFEDISSEQSEPTFLSDTPENLNPSTISKSNSQQNQQPTQQNNKDKDKPINIFSDIKIDAQSGPDTLKPSGSTMLNRVQNAINAGRNAAEGIAQRVQDGVEGAAQKVGLKSQLRLPIQYPHHNPEIRKSLHHRLLLLAAAKQAPERKQIDKGHSYDLGTVPKDVIVLAPQGSPQNSYLISRPGLQFSSQPATGIGANLQNQIKFPPIVDPAFSYGGWLRRQVDFILWCSIVSVHTLSILHAVPLVHSSLTMSMPSLRDSNPPTPIGQTLPFPTNQLSPNNQQGQSNRRTSPTPLQQPVTYHNEPINRWILPEIYLPNNIDQVSESVNANKNRDTQNNQFQRQSSELKTYNMPDLLKFLFNVASSFSKLQPLSYSPANERTSVNVGDIQQKQGYRYLMLSQISRVLFSIANGGKEKAHQFSTAASGEVNQDNNQSNENNLLLMGIPYICIIRIVRALIAKGCFNGYMLESQVLDLSNSYDEGEQQNKNNVRQQYLPAGDQYGYLIGCDYASIVDDNQDGEEDDDSIPKRYTLSEGFNNIRELIIEGILTPIGLNRLIADIILLSEIVKRMVSPPHLISDQKERKDKLEGLKITSRTGQRIKRGNVYNAFHLHGKGDDGNEDLAEEFAQNDLFDVAENIASLISSALTAQIFSSESDNEQSKSFIDESYSKKAGHKRSSSMMAQPTSPPKGDIFSSGHSLPQTSRPIVTRSHVELLLVRPLLLECRNRLGLFLADYVANFSAFPELLGKYIKVLSEIEIALDAIDNRIRKQASGTESRGSLNNAD